MGKGKDTAAWIAVVGIAIATAGTIVVALINQPNDDKAGGGTTPPPTQTSTSVWPPPDTPSPTPTPPPTTKSVAPAPFIVTLDSVSPRGGRKGISSKDGLVAKGTVKNLPPGHSVWLMDRDETDYTIAQPARVSGASWTAESYPLGDSNVAVPYDMTVVVVKANVACTSALRKRVRLIQYQMPDLPKGCTEAGQRDIRVSEK